MMLRLALVLKAVCQLSEVRAQNLRDQQHMFVLYTLSSAIASWMHRLGNLVI